MATFHELKVEEIVRETADSVVVSFDIPSDVRESFKFDAGQYLTLRTTLNGEEIRRSYSLCSAPFESKWRVGIKKVPQGKFSTYANEQLQTGMTLEVMEPQGRFVVHAGRGFHHAGFAAGSGITPVLSQVKHILATDSEAQFTLFYSNKTASSTMFREELQDLKDRYLGRFRVFFLLTREPVDSELLSGRLDEVRCMELLNRFCSDKRIDAAYLCGPESMILGCKDALLAYGLEEESIRFELFTSSLTKQPVAPASNDATTKSSDELVMQVVLDGVTTSVRASKDKSLLDAALDAGLDAPYSCLGGVCCTCRAKLVQGQANMEVNYALEPGEVDRGYVLSCQAHVVGEEAVVLDFDQQ